MIVIGIHRWQSPHFILVIRGKMFLYLLFFHLFLRRLAALLLLFQLICTCLLIVSIVLSFLLRLYD